MNQLLTVGQLSAVTGVSARAIRHYEVIGLLESIRDAHSNYRLYDLSEAAKLDRILFLKGTGFSLKEIVEIIDTNGSKAHVTDLISARLKKLRDATTLLRHCSDILTDFLDICSKQQGEYIDGLSLLSQSRYFSTENMDIAPNNLVYIEDPDLEFLKFCKYEDLYELDNYLSLGQDDVDILLKSLGSGTSGKGRGCLSGELYRPENYWKLISAQIQRLEPNGMNSIYSNKIIPYKDMIKDICGKFGAECDASSVINLMEECLLMKICQSAKDKMDEKNLSAISSLRLNQTAFVIYNAMQRNLSEGYCLASAQKEALEKGIFEFVWAFDWTIKEMWTVADFLGRSYKAILPVVFYIAYLRLKYSTN